MQITAVNFGGKFPVNEFRERRIPEIYFPRMKIRVCEYDYEFHFSRNSFKSRKKSRNGNLFPGKSNFQTFIPKITFQILKKLGIKKSLIQ